MDILERRNEVILISLDVDGAFDRVWHNRLLRKLRLRGLKGRALKLIKSYLRDRYIEVVVGKLKSARRGIFSGVSQGGKWSAPSWDVDIATLEELEVGGLISYADDCGLLYEVTDSNRCTIVDEITADLADLASGGIKWHVLFASDKTYGMVISRKKIVFDASGIVLQGHPMEFVSELKLVGFIFDQKMTMRPMVQMASKKNRAKIAALFRLRPYLDAANLETMYKAFVRSFFYVR